MVDNGLQHQLSLLGIHLPSSLSILSASPSFHPSRPRQGASGIVLRLIEEANLSDKKAAIAGFLPLSLRKLLEFYRPHTYRQDFEDLRIHIIDLCARRYDVYRRESWIKWVAERKKEKRKKLINGENGGSSGWTH
jgi:hypothetical protein